MRCVDLVDSRSETDEISGIVENKMQCSALRGVGEMVCELKY